MYSDSKMNCSRTVSSNHSRLQRVAGADEERHLWVQTLKLFVVVGDEVTVTRSKQNYIKVSELYRKHCMSDALCGHLG